MILRSHFCVLCLATVYLTSDAFYLKYKAPTNKAIKVIQNDAGKMRYPRHIDDITQWLRHNNLKQLVVLNRKDKRVEQLIKQLILLIEQSHLPATAIKPKMCQKTFGSIYDERNKRVICERYTSSYKKPQLNLIIPIKRNQDQSTEDISTNEDLRRNFRSFSTTEMSSAPSLTEESTVELERPTRFEIVGNDGKKKDRPLRDAKKKQRKLDSNSAAEDESRENQSDEESVKYDDNSNEKKGNLDSREYVKTKPMYEEEQYSSVKKKPPYENESVEEKYSFVKKKPLSDDESIDDKYSYMQGSRIIDTLRRQNRDRHFMPKRYNWDSDELHHLGYYWFEGNRR